MVDPTLAGPLEDLGLLRILDPEQFLDVETAAKLTGMVESLLEAGAFDDLPTIYEPQAISRSRAMPREIGNQMIEKLMELGLAKRSQDGVSIGMHPAVRTTYLLLLAQLARETGGRQGLDLHPVTNAEGAQRGIRELLEQEPMPSRGHVVDYDLQVVGVDLDDIPLDEVLDFRHDSADSHRRYMQNLRRFTLELSGLEGVDRVRALEDRRAELEEEAHKLEAHSMSAWRKPSRVGAFSLGIAGAGWSLATANPVPAALAALGAGLNLLPGKPERSAYSYVFDARRSLR